MFRLCASKKWPVTSFHIKTAFLQGKDLERTAFVRPPKEAQTNKIWQLQKCVYGLVYASRYWYVKIRKELRKSEGRPSKLDQGIFYFYNRRKMIVTVSLFVDDLLWAVSADHSEAKKLIPGWLRKSQVIHLRWDQSKAKIFHHSGPTRIH